MGKPPISTILKRLMFEQGLKTMELARRTGLPQPTVHRIVSGDAHNPHQASLVALAKYFDISVAQLKGDESIPRLAIETELRGLKQIPLISLQNATKWPNILKSEQMIEALFTTGNISPHAFATTLEDSAMYPIFPKGTQIIIDPEKEIKDRCYVLVALQSQSAAIFRQLIIDAGNYYLKPLSPDLTYFEMLPFKTQDKILGVLAEARKSYEE